MSLISNQLLSNLLLDGAGGGLKFAKGTVTSNSTLTSFDYAGGSTSDLYTVTVSILDFLPQQILLYENTTNNPNSMTVLFPDDLYTDAEDGRIIASEYSIFSSSGTPRTIRLTGNASISDTGFVMPVFHASVSYHYLAFAEVEL